MKYRVKLISNGGIKFLVANCKLTTDVKAGRKIKPLSKRNTETMIKPHDNILTFF
jgi:hypothetical protein